MSSKKKKPDIDHPGKFAPPATSKPVIVTNRPVLKDPMMVAADENSGEEDKEKLTHTTGPKLQPLKQPAKKETEERKPPTEEKPVPAAPAEPSEESTEPEAELAHKNTDQEAARQAQHEAEVQKLIDSKKYELPINAVEKRKARHFVVLGILLSVLLALAWADVALDAGLIQIDGVKPVTHFFSN